MVEFSATAKEKWHAILSRYPRREAALLPTLWLAQEEFGTITTDVMAYVAALLEIAPAKVLSVATFYTMYHTKPVGKYHIQVCRTLSCALCNGENIAQYLKKKLKINMNETTPDGKFTLSAVECLANCDQAPVMQINDQDYGHLTPEKIDEILNNL